MSLTRLIPVVLVLLSGTALSVHGYLESRRPPVPKTLDEPAQFELPARPTTPAATLPASKPPCTDAEAHAACPPGPRRAG